MVDVFFWKHPFCKELPFCSNFVVCFLGILHSVMFHRFIITEWMDQPDLCNVNGDRLVLSATLKKRCL